jgi:hypothetical protein
LVVYCDKNTCFAFGCGIPFSFLHQHLILNRCLQHENFRLHKKLFTPQIWLSSCGCIPKIASLGFFVSF